MPPGGASRRGGTRTATAGSGRAAARPLRTILIVGGAGRMGRLLARSFRDAGRAVAIHDPGARLAGFPSVPLETVAAADVVVVSTSLEATPAVLAEVLALSPPGLVLDVASVKGPLLPLHARAARRGLTVASAHPMFGPASARSRGRTSSSATPASLPPRARRRVSSPASASGSRRFRSTTTTDGSPGPSASPTSSRSSRARRSPARE
jgi:Prephenate dehydrogenase